MFINSHQKKTSCRLPSCFFFIKLPYHPPKKKKKQQHSIHVWYIYLHLVDCYGKCIYINMIYVYHTWMLWEIYSQKPRHTELERKVSTVQSRCFLISFSVKLCRAACTDRVGSPWKTTQIHHETESRRLLRDGQRNQ